MQPAGGDHGRLTLPTEQGAHEETLRLVERLGADAVRNSDGTELPEGIGEVVDRVYATRFVARGDNEWARAHPEQATQIYLMSERVTATDAGPLTIDPMAAYLADQFAPELSDPHRWWEVRDRTAGQVVPTSEWTVDDGGRVRLETARPWHEYTVAFLARQTWDSTQIHNYTTNGWDVEKDATFDVRHDQTWAHVQQSLRDWLAAHPHVDVVRFTTFFYHFTLAFADDGAEKFVDWFGYSTTASIPAMEAFERRHGYRPTPEDFVDAGYHNSPFRPPSPVMREWMDFVGEFVAERAAALVRIVHDAGREAMMFLGDNWIGTEPYGPRWAGIGLDAVVGSVGSAATCRMISDIDVPCTEGRLLPYFFPDVFHEGGDPLGEARDSWRTARRALMRRPLDRIGYGGYLSLATGFPDFVDEMESVVTEFRELHARAAGESPWTAPVTVAILNHWGALRSWQTHMVAHALWYREIYTYLGVLESLAGLPVEVRFLSFDDVAGGVPDGIDVLLNAGTAGTAFSGGDVWADPALLASIRAFVAGGGGFIGVGEPSAHVREGRTFALADVLGVDQEVGFSLSTDKRVPAPQAHPITDGLDQDPAAPAGAPFATGERARSVYPCASETTVLALEDEQVTAAVHEYGSGRSVYLAGLPYDPVNARLLYRACLWAAGLEADEQPWRVEGVDAEIAAFPRAGLVMTANLTEEDVTASVHTPGGSMEVRVPAHRAVWSRVPSAD